MTWCWTTGSSAGTPADEVIAHGGRQAVVTGCVIADRDDAHRRRWERLTPETGRGPALAAEPLRCDTIGLAAYHLAAIDRRAERGTGPGADQRAQRSRAVAGDRAAEQSASDPADHETGGCIRAAAVISVVATAIDAIVARQAIRAIGAAATVELVGIIAVRAGWIAETTRRSP